jgi:predicted transposase YbfD/YdcC
MYETFCKLHDPRVLGRSSHKLTDILILSVVAVICGADSYDAIELFGKAHHEELKRILELPNEIPSHDTINRVFQSINARHFERLFAEWASGLRDSGKAGGVVAIDGKTMCGSKDTFRGKNPLHIVSAWSVANALCLGQFKTGDKSNEITAIPQLMEMLDIKGTIVTIDAMGTQKDIAKKIVEAGADYILAVKGNQETLLEDVETMCDYERPAAEDTDVDKGHGRIEVRLCQAFDPDAIIRMDHKGWPELKSVVRVKATHRRQGDHRGAPLHQQPAGQQPLQHLHPQPLGGREQAPLDARHDLPRRPAAQTMQNGRTELPSRQEVRPERPQKGQV